MMPGTFGGSSSGRTADSDSANRGSNPRPPAKRKQGLSLTARPFFFVLGTLAGHSAATLPDNPSASLATLNHPRRVTTTPRPTAGKVPHFAPHCPVSAPYPDMAALQSIINSMLHCLVMGYVIRYCALSWIAAQYKTGRETLERLPSPTTANR